MRLRLRKLKNRCKKPKGTCVKQTWSISAHCTYCDDYIDNQLGMECEEGIDSFIKAIGTSIFMRSNLYNNNQPKQ